MIARMRIAAAACLVASGLLVAGPDVALASAKPTTSQGDGKHGPHARADDRKTPSATSPAPRATHAPTVRDRPGRTAASRRATSAEKVPSKHRRPGAEGPPKSGVAKAGEPAIADAPQPSPTDAERRPRWWNWLKWPWCWPTGPGQPGPGRPPVSLGSGGGGGGGVVTPPRRLPTPPPLMQLSVPRERTPVLPVVSVDPPADAGPATALPPLAPITLPAIVVPLGAAPRPGPPPSTAARPGGTNQQPRGGRQNPAAYGANDGGAAISFRPGYGTYLRNAGIGHMAAVAIPGVAGILVLTAAGGLVGYRQARAGHSVHSNGTTRFVG